MKANIKPELLTWARERAAKNLSELLTKFPKLHEWEQGTRQPTIVQLQKFADFVHVPIGYLFLSKPIEEPLPITDFRTNNNETINKPSINLLEVIDICQKHQAWYHDYAYAEELTPPDFVGKATTADNPLDVADLIRKKLDLSPETRSKIALIPKLEDCGVIIMVNSVVGNNTSRKLDVGEFRGFALSDNLAPLIFINGSDSKTAQTFTLIHEFAHLWLGKSGVSNVRISNVHTSDALDATEKWCNAVAVEVLVPITELKTRYQSNKPVTEQIENLASHFKVSTLVIFYRLINEKLIRPSDAQQYLIQENTTIQSSKKSGGDFYKTLFSRNSKKFTKALIRSTLAGDTLFRDAFKLLGLRSSDAFYAAAKKLEVIS